MAHSTFALAAAWICIGLHTALLASSWPWPAAPAPVAVAVGVGVGVDLLRSSSPWLSSLVLFAAWCVVGLPAAMSLLFNLAAGVVDVHVLMALAAFGTLPLGCPGEGALLLALFASAHLVEDRLMTVAEGDLSQLLDATPATAMRVAIRPFDMGPDLQSLTEVRT